MILKGERNPGAELTEKLVTDLRLRSSEADYFRNLVHLAKTDSEHIKSLILEKLNRRNPRQEFRPISSEVFRVFSNLLPAALREMVDLADFREDFDWIQSKLSFKATKSEIESSLRSLTNLGLLSRDKKKKLKYNFLAESPYDVPRESGKQFHESVFQRCSEAIRTVDPLDREISGLTFTMKAADLAQLKQRIRDFLRETADQPDSECDTVYHLEVACIPLTKGDR